MFACVPRHVLQPHNRVLRATDSVAIYLCLDNSYVLSYLITNRSFRHRRAMAGHRALTFLPLTWPSTVVAQRKSHTNDSVVCRCAANSAVLAYCCGCRDRLSSQQRCRLASGVLASDRHFEIRPAYRLFSVNVSISHVTL